MNSNFKHTFDDNVSEAFELNGSQGWRPSMAYPLFVGFGLRKPKCGCGRTFKNLEDFQAHYLYHAVWLNESGYVVIKPRVVV